MNRTHRSIALGVADRIAAGDNVVLWLQSVADLGGPLAHGLRAAALRIEGGEPVGRALAEHDCVEPSVGAALDAGSADAVGTLVRAVMQLDDHRRHVRSLFLSVTALGLFASGVIAFAAYGVLPDLAARRAEFGVAASSWDQALLAFQVVAGPLLLLLLGATAAVVVSPRAQWVAARTAGSRHSAALRATACRALGALLMAGESIEAALRHTAAMLPGSGLRPEIEAASGRIAGGESAVAVLGSSSLSARGAGALWRAAAEPTAAVATAEAMAELLDAEAESERVAIVARVRRRYAASLGVVVLWLGLLMILGTYGLVRWIPFE